MLIPFRFLIKSIKETKSKVSEERSIKRLNKRNRRYGGLNTETEEENLEQGKLA